MRLHPALALAAALLPALAAAQTDEWVRDDMSDESLWLLRTSNLAREAPRAGTLPGAPDGSSHWVMSKGDGPAYVVYFIPGRIHEVEIDTHRLAGATGDFSLAVSTDGKLYQPLDAGAVLLDTSFGWDYRLMASDQIPENATHLLVQFPDGSTAHSLSEVWIRYTWDDALISRFLPEPAAAAQQQETLAAQSDADLQKMLEVLMPQAAPPAAQEVSSIADGTPETIEPAAFFAEPPRAPNIVENAAPPVEFATPHAAENTIAPVVIEEAPVVSIAPDATPGEFAVDATDPAPDEANSTPAIEPPEAQTELEPLIEVTLSVDPADDVAALPVSESAPTESDAVEVQAEVAMETGESPVAAASTGAVSESQIESPAPLSEPLDAETPEEVHVLPVFTLPVFAGAESSEAPPSPQFESPPQTTAESVVLEPASPAIAEVQLVAPDEPAPIESTTPAVEPPPAPVEVWESPAPPQDPDPALVAEPTAPVALPESDHPAEITEDDDPKAKPAMKVRRFGPRSKSRGTFVARD